RDGSAPIGPGLLGSVMLKSQAQTPRAASASKQVVAFMVGASAQKSRSMEKKMLRLGGNGATSMLRAIAWLPKFDTSGSMPRNFVILISFLALCDTVGLRTRAPYN